MATSIHLSANAPFYVAVCKQDEHSWLTLGATEPSTGITYTLAYYGKRIAFAKDYQCKGRCTTMFGTVPGVLTRDYRFKTALNTGKAVDFEYKAFAITRDNYLEFAKHIKGIIQDKYQNFDQRTREYHKNELYYPNKENPNQFDFIDINEVPQAHDARIDSDIERLGASDNCRHTVLSLLKKFIEHGNNMAKGISTFAYQNLPYKAVYQQERIIGNFFVLPVPPINDGNKALYQIRCNLYKRLEKIPALKMIDSVTMNKFNAVKALYESLSPTEQQQNLSDVLDTIHHWESQNAKTIDSCRLFKTEQTKTRKMVDDIKLLAVSQMGSMS